MQKDEPDSTFNSLISAIRIQKEKNQQLTQKKRIIIGVCGVPGAGKSTISHKLKEKLPELAVLPMDGFHLPRKMLDEEGVRRRGAAFTFDLKGFAQKMKEIKESSIHQ